MRNRFMYVTHLNLLVETGVVILLTFLVFVSVTMYAFFTRTVVLILKNCAKKMTQKPK